MTPASENPPASPSSAFEKRVKRRISARIHEFFAVCPPGLKTVCTDELTQLHPDIKEIQPLTGGVAFKTKLPTACLANLSLGSPSKILMRIDNFKAENFPTLEKKNQTDRLGAFFTRQYRSGYPGDGAQIKTLPFRCH